MSDAEYGPGGENYAIGYHEGYDDGYAQAQCQLVAEIVQLREKLNGLHREWGLQYDKHPSDVVFGRPSNPDGTITQVIAMSDKSQARQAHASHAPIGAINKFVVSRLATDWRIVDDLDA